MKRNELIWIMVLLGILFGGHRAEAFVGGWGDIIYKVADVPDSTPREKIGNNMPMGVDVGYKQTHFHLLWMPLAQWDGQFVLYKGNQYWEFPRVWTHSAVVADWGLKSDAINKPFLAYVPWGWYVVGPIGIFFWWMGQSAEKTERRTVAAARNDPRFRNALAILSQNPGGVGLQQAVAYLCEQGVPEDTALKLLARIQSDMQT